MSVLQAAIKYTERGWRVIPVPHREKNPGFDKWEQLRLDRDDLPHRFNGRPQNIGVLLGEPSRWLIDVDLDHELAVRLAAEFLPPTPAKFGRKSKPLSHWLYYTSGPVATKKIKSKSAGMIVELRSTGMQTVFPPSTHASDEAIEWDELDVEPATIDPQLLLDAVLGLGNHVKVELGEKSVRPPKVKRERSKRPSRPAAETGLAPPLDKRRELCFEAMRRIGIVDQNDGSSRLFAAACRVVEHDLDDTAAVEVIRQYEKERPFPREWTDSEILTRIRDAERTTERNAAFAVDGAGLIQLGQRDPASGRLVLSPKRTLPTAEAFVRDFHAHPDSPTIVNYAGLLMEWAGNRYAEIEDGAVRKKLQPWLHGALRYVLDRSEGGLILGDFESNPTTINAALESIRSFTHLDARTPSPSWLGREPDGMTPKDILPCRSTLLHLPTMQHLPATPRFFTTSALDFDPDPDAPPPLEWHKFLHQLFEGDWQSLDLLQEWFGYCLTGDTSLQKMLLIVGPKRSGKGTIARVLTQLVGAGNVCGPTTSSLANHFGLQPLIGKTLAIVSDARFSGENVATVVERLLCISGEDTLSIPRKFLGDVTMKLPTRFTFLTNEFPRLTDASGALASRFVMLRLTASFYGKEDPRLTEKLLVELPGILNWAIEGWTNLKERGHFVMPPSVTEMIQEIEDLSSPVSAFVRDECEVGAGHRVSLDTLYDAWRRWCTSEGRQIVTTKSTFGRDLAAAVPGIARRRGTNQQPFYEGIALRCASEW